MEQTLNTDGALPQKYATKNMGVDQEKTLKKGRRQNHPWKLSPLNSEVINQLPPDIMVTPATPGTETPPRKPSILPASLVPSKFTEWKTSTRQGRLIHFNPLTDNASPDSLTKYSMYTPRNFLERSRRDHTLFLGSSIDGPELGFTRELPHGYLFTVGTPMIPGKEKPEYMRWPCENEMSKGGKKEAKWEFKADLSLYGMGREWVWVRTKGLGSGSGINEMELRDAKGTVAAIWRRGGSAFRGRLWLRNGEERYAKEEYLKIVRMRWEIAVLLTWRLVLDRSIKRGDLRPLW